VIEVVKTVLVNCDVVGMIVKWMTGGGSIGEWVMVSHIRCLCWLWCCRWCFVLVASHLSSVGFPLFALLTVSLLPPLITTLLYRVAHASLNKQLIKYQKKAKKNKTPRCFVRTFSMLDAALEKLSPKQAKKSLLGKQFKAYNGLRMRVRKESALLRSLVTAYRKNPDPESEEEEPEEEEVDEDSDSDAAADADSDNASPAAATETGGAVAPKARGISYWLKKGGPSSSSSSSDKSDVESEEPSEESSDDEQSVLQSSPTSMAGVSDEETADGGEDEEDEAAEKEAEEEKKKKKWTAEKVDEALEEMFAPRSGKRKLQYAQIMEQLRALLVHAKNPAQHIVMHLHLVQATFDEFTSLKQKLKRSIWVDCFSNLCSVMEMVDSDRSLTLTPPQVLRKYIQFTDDVVGVVCVFCVSVWECGSVGLSVRCMCVCNCVIVCVCN
jgi:Eukaryotic translation initiation factor 3 subunit 8 N-terminus